jgi:tetratricopeptide (TPR) repeat protein
MAPAPMAITAAGTIASKTKYTMSDIKKYIKIISEAQDMNQAKIEQWVVDEMKRILADPEDDGGNLWNVYEYLDYAVYDQIKDQSDEVAKLYQKLSRPTNAKALFTKAVGMTPAKFCNKYHKEQDALAMAKLTPLDKKIWKTLGDYMTCGLNPRDASRLEWYKYSVNKLVVQLSDSKMPAVTVGPNMLKTLGLPSIDVMINWLKKAGVGQVKKPKPIKYTPSYYD